MRREPDLRWSTAVSRIICTTCSPRLVASRCTPPSLPSPPLTTPRLTSPYLSPPSATPHRAKKAPSRKGGRYGWKPSSSSKFSTQLFELIPLSKLDKQSSIERFEPTASQSTVSSPTFTLSPIYIYIYR